MVRTSQTYPLFFNVPPIALVSLLLLKLFCCTACTTDTANPSNDSAANRQNSDSGQNTPDTGNDTDNPEESETETADSSSAPDTYQILCDDNATTVLDNRGRLQNNVWGYTLSSFTDYVQCVFYNTAAPGEFGWEWRLEGKSDFPSYPRIGFGWNPWDRESTTDILPRRIPSISSLIVSFEKVLETDGLYNTAFDIWLTDAEAGDSDTIIAEIMVWLDGTQPQSATLTADSIVINSNTWDFYKNTTWNEFPYLAFVQQEHTWRGEIDFVPFVSYLVENDHLAADAYIAEVEFGNEIWSDSGKMVVRDFSIAIE